MITIVCMGCAFALRVMPAMATDLTSAREVQQLVGRNSTLWPDRFPCVRCGKHARGFMEHEVDPKALALLEVRDLTPQEAFQAFNGLGLPEEQACALSSVQQLLVGQVISKIVGSDVKGLDRTIIDSLELQDGTRIYLGAGAEGACIYRIVKPQSVASRVLSEMGS